MRTNITMITRPTTQYGPVRTLRSACFIASKPASSRSALSAVLAGCSLACMKFIATYMPISEPIGLKHWAKFSLLVDVSSDPMLRMYGLQLVSRKDRPQVIMK